MPSRPRRRIVTSAGLDVTERATNDDGWHVTLRRRDRRRPLRARAIEDEPLRRRGWTALIAARAPAPAARARPRRTACVPVLLHPNVVEEYVLGTLLDNLDGASVAHGEGAFRREQFGSGRPVLREDLALRLDPLMPLRAGVLSVHGRGRSRAAPARSSSAAASASRSLDLKYARRLGLPADARFPTPWTRVVFEGARTALAAGGTGLPAALLVLRVLGVHTQDPPAATSRCPRRRACARARRALGSPRARHDLGQPVRSCRRERHCFRGVRGRDTPGLLRPLPRRLARSDLTILPSRPNKLGVPLCGGLPMPARPVHASRPRRPSRKRSPAPPPLATPRSVPLHLLRAGRSSARASSGPIFERLGADPGAVAAAAAARARLDPRVTGRCRAPALAQPGRAAPRAPRASLASSRTSTSPPSTCSSPWRAAAERRPRSSPLWRDAGQGSWPRCARCAAARGSPTRTPRTSSRRSSATRAI